MTTTTYHRSENASAYRQNASFVYSDAYTAPVLALLDPQPGDQILDLGCGSGELTLNIAKAVDGDGKVVGLDASQDMISKAEALLSSTTAAAAGDASSSDHDLQHRVEFRIQDGQDASTTSYFHQHSPTSAGGVKFDKVFSNAALHWMKGDPVQVVRNVYSVLPSGGRFAAEMGGFTNCVGLRSQLHVSLRKRGYDPELLDPWYFPTVDEYRQMLERVGFAVESCELVPRLTALPVHSGLKGWVSTFGGPFLNSLPNDQMREDVVNEVQQALKPDCYDQRKDQWYVMYARLRVLAFKP